MQSDVTGSVAHYKSTATCQNALMRSILLKMALNKYPLMLHRVIVGSIERFTGILIEHYEGAFPSWLAPIQAVILNISQKQEEFSKNVEKNLKKQGLRVISDLRNEKIGFKIREHSMQRYPYILVVGDREVENNQVSVRRRGGEDLGSMSLEALIELINQE